MDKPYNHFGVPFLNIENYELNPEVVTLIPEETVRAFKILPIDLLQNILTLGMCNIDDKKIIPILESKFNYKVIPFQVDMEAWVNVINKIYSKERRIVNA